METVVEAGTCDLGPEAIEGSVMLCSRSVNVRGRCRDAVRHRPSQVAEHLLRAGAGRTLKTCKTAFLSI